MYLAEEYFKRHQMKVPHIQHVDQATVFMRWEGPKGIQWQILQANYKTAENHPGVYTVHFTRPVHNGYERSGRFEQVGQSKTLEWDQYEDYLMDIHNHVEGGMKVVRNITDIILVGWEMFVYLYDGVLAKVADHESLFRSLDLDATPMERHKGYQEASSYLARHHANYYTSWNNEIVPYIRRYSHWLAGYLSAEGK